VVVVAVYDQENRGTWREFCGWNKIVRQFAEYLYLSNLKTGREISFLEETPSQGVRWKFFLGKINIGGTLVP
jgi:hypothetical protein